MAGTFFSFEGVDGAGKTTQVELLRQNLSQQGYDVLSLREPGGTLLGERIRSLLLDKSEEPPVPRAELLLFAAARAQLVQTRILPALERGAIVILDRFVDATFAYQAMARGLPEADVIALETIAAGILPDRTWILDLTPEQSNARRALRGEAPDRMESEGDAFRARVREGYLERARRHPERISLLNADCSIDDLANTLLGQANSFLKSHS